MLFYWGGMNIEYIAKTGLFWGYARFNLNAFTCGKHSKSTPKLVSERWMIF